MNFLGPGKLFCVLTAEYETINNFVNKIYGFISMLMFAAFTIHEVLMKAIILPEKSR